MTTFHNSALLALGAALFLLLVVSSSAVPSECGAKVSAPTCNRAAAAFGMARTATAGSLSLRGGAIAEPATLPDVESIILKASAEGKLVVIDFTATWCGPCKMIAPFFEELSETYGDVVFLKVDVDANPDTAAKYSVSAMPTFVFIKKGEVLDRLMGANPAKLESMIQDNN